MTGDVKNIITETLNRYWGEIEKQYSYTDKNKVINDMFEKHIPQLFGNFEYMKNRMHYLVHECESWYNLNNIIEKDMYMKIYKINENDSKRTITAKIKAFMDGRKYKGSINKSRKIETFYERNGDGTVENKKGEIYLYKNFKFFISKDEKCEYKATEERSGMSLGGRSRNKELLKKTVRELINEKQEVINKAIESAVKKYGDLREYNSES